ncbi:hypothetical protein [Roseibium alexandrii]|uniref:Uncharacterized protein n=1 Tax=Roseibium alexandrii TaxID=388408 RepID=A0A0M7A045_9HYPH|nr:hypothetical protein [Roseibium alexandrii]CTQ67183.1 hypothetical protein LAX5112_01253 [Roseibium alexandrii]
MTTAFAKEADLCSLFIKCLPRGWTAYPETGGFDILLSRDSDGFQIGVEAKLRLNAKVIQQAMEGRSWSRVAGPGPDCRAVLVPSDARGGMEPVCAALGITPIRMQSDLKLDQDGNPMFQLARQKEIRILAQCHTSVGTCWAYPFRPSLPANEHSGRDDWFERCPDRRLTLPDYVPDVSAGESAPVALTQWKIKAIKIVVTLERRGYLTRRDFKHFKISMSRWIEGFDPWLVKDGNGGWVSGSGLPDFRKQHPINFSQIETDYESWRGPEEASQPGLFAGKGAAA